MNKFKAFLVSLLAAGALLTAGGAHARYAAIMVDADTGNVLHEIDATRPWYPASLTKVMTLYMTFDALSRGRIGLHDRMTASYHAAEQPQSKLGLRAGETISVEEAILALITRSANDAAVVLAEHLGGSEEGFASHMTAKARQLGMHGTRFMNATGLPNNLQVTTSRDLAVLAWKIMKHFPNYYPYFASHSFYFKGRELPGINKFTARYPGAEGMKTGFTCGSGFNLMSTAVQNGKRLIGVILGGTTSAERYRLMENMMDAGFSQRYGNGGYRNINMMNASMGGEPPYQLSCGKGARNAEASAPRSYYRPHPVNKRLIAPRHARNATFAARHGGYHRPVHAKTRAGYHRLAAGKKHVTVAKAKRNGAVRVAKRGVKSKAARSAVAQRSVKKRNRNS